MYNWLKCCIIVIILLIQIMIINSQINEELIEKDLYKVLNIDPTANKAEIKKAYRKLAQIHHPDKSTAKDREKNEMMFREIAQAYEILSNDDTREEYELMRSYIRDNTYRYHDRRGGNEPNEPNTREMYEQYQKQAQREYEAYHKQQQRAFEEMEEDYIQELRDFEQFLEDNAEEIQQHLRQQELEWIMQPALTGSVVMEGEVIFPYSPMMTSTNGEYYAVLDFECSMKIYQGDPEYALHTIYASEDVPDFSPFSRLLYYTEPQPDLNGKCFAGLDDRGILSIFHGFPDQYNVLPVWSNEQNMDASWDSDMRMFRRYFIELQNDGSLTIQALSPGDPDSECIWSTTSCDEYISLVKGIGKDVLHGLLNVYHKSIHSSKHALHQKGWLGLGSHLFKNTVKISFKITKSIIALPIHFILKQLKLDKSGSKGGNKNKRRRSSTNINEEDDELEEEEWNLLNERIKASSIL